jgi:hypothetical protein
MKLSIYRGACVALAFLHTAFSFPTQPNHGFGFHRRGSVAGLVVARAQKENFFCKLSRNHPWLVEIFRSFASPTTLFCIGMPGVVLHCWGKSSTVVEKRWGESNSIVEKRWGESNAIAENRFGIPFTLLCWSLGIYLLFKAPGEVIKVQWLCFSIRRH